MTINVVLIVIMKLVIIIFAIIKFNKHHGNTTDDIIYSRIMTDIFICTESTIII